MGNHAIAPVRPIVAKDGTQPPAILYLRYLSLVPAAIVVAALYFGRPVLLPLAVGVLFAFALAPLVGRLRRIGAGHILSVLIAAVLAISVTAAIGVYITTRTIELAGELPRYQTNLIEKIRSIRGTAMDGGAVERASNLLKTLRDQLVTRGRELPRAQGPVVRQGEAPVTVQIQEPDAEPIELAAAFVLPLVGFLLAAGIVVIFVVFILLYKEDIRDRFIRLAGSEDIQKATLLLDDGAERLGHYLLTQTAINAVFGLLIGVGLWLIGIPNPTLWGLAVVILRFIPYVGVPLAAVLPVLLGLSVDPGWSMALWTILLFAVSELTFGQAIEPWLFGRRMGMSPLAIVVAATFWTWLWGPMGLLLSTPLTMCLVVLGRHVKHLQFLDVLLGDRAPLSAEESLYIRLLGDDADQAAAEAESFLKENTISRYYDDVALRALAIGDADARRGALDHDRALKIKDSTEALIQNLSDVQTAESEGADIVQGAMGAATVLCIGGRGPLDEAAALLLASLLEKRNVRARLATAREASETASHEHDTDSIKAVCVCYLDPANSARAPFLMRRIKRRIPGAAPIAAFLCADNPTPPADDGYRVVTTLDGAVQAISAALASEATSATVDPPAPEETPHGRPGRKKPVPLPAD
jgi:predicted PurR-regulated permease PerM